MIRTDLVTLTAPGALEQQLEAVRDMLAACVSVDDARSLADQAAAMQAYARRARLSREALNYAAEVKLRAERRAGELLSREVQRGGDPKSHVATLATVGVSKTQSSRWQQIACIPDEAFEAYLAKYRAGEHEIASQRLYELAQQYRRNPSIPQGEVASVSLPVVPDGGGPLPGLRPYYADAAAGIYLYCADAWACQDLLVALGADVLITDPPYGVALGTSKTTTGLYRNGRAGYARYSDTHEEWQQLVPPLLRRLIPSHRRAAVWAGPHSWELPEPVAIGGIYCPAAMGRHAWGFKNFLPVLFYGKDPLQGAGPGTGCYPTGEVSMIESNATAKANGHPCPKPIEWLNWLVKRASRAGEIILDPFAGSGTTLQAAKTWGRPAVGIEVDEQYCEIAARSLMQMLDLPLEDVGA